ncbi:MAG TPA: ScpA family protein [Beutenbergiaceae bacterium]|nr:ScpA family protein [Beutenbergiaceae bacterium]
MATSPESDAPSEAFHLRLENFTGPFDLLLSLINKKELDVTEVALAQVTDEFVSYIAAQDEWLLDEASEFLLIAATLLDLKAARLLPRGEVEDDQDLELLEARDLLFARLLQYRAYKEVSQWMGQRLEQESLRHPRTVGLEPQFSALLPELIWHLSIEEFAQIAARAFTPEHPEVVDFSHLHAPVVSVQEQAAVMVTRLRRHKVVSFRQLVSDADGVATVVARFLALLELYKEHVIAFEQAAPLADLSVRWTGEDHSDVQVETDYDEEQPTHG